MHNGRLNRQQREELERRFHAAEPDPEFVHPHAVGIDIGNEGHFVAAPSRDLPSVQELECWTAHLQRMAAWLKSCNVTAVAK
jgi:hypothetical protein